LSSQNAILRLMVSGWLGLVQGWVEAAVSELSMVTSLKDRTGSPISALFGNRK
jgi:hypothetical protein